MNSRRSLSSLQPEPTSKRTPIITIKHTDLHETHQKSTGNSQYSSKKMKLRDYIYLNQITEKRRSLQKPNAMNRSQTTLFQTFNGNSGKNIQKGTPLRYNRRKIEAQEVFDEVRKEIDSDLSKVVETALKLKACLNSMPKTSIKQSLMIQLYEMRHKIKYSSLLQLKKCDQSISALYKTMEIVNPIESRIQSVQSLTFSEPECQIKEQKRAQGVHKVCMWKRREGARR